MPDTAAAKPSRPSPQPPRRVHKLSAIPSLITVANGVLGFAAIVELAKAYGYVQLDSDANRSGKERIEDQKSVVEIHVIATDEELTIARQISALIPG